MTPDEFTTLITPITQFVSGKPVDESLIAELDRRFPAGGAEFDTITAACHQAIDDGWMCNREGGGIKFGRVVKPGPATHGFSVDVVDMEDVVGPYHRHPKGEIDMIMPVTPGARFDGYGHGWFVYGPQSEHAPTVADGRALVLYLLPDGAIEFL